MWIQNIAYTDVKNGYHYDAGPNSMMINIVDPGMEFPQSLYKFKEVHRFEFLDIESDGLTNLGDGEMTDMSEFAITDDQAKELVKLLKHALDNKMNVVVSCVAGVCRSGAVAEVGTILGFEDTETFRSPNLLVKHKMMKELGLTYNEDEKHSINGKPLDEDWIDDNEKIFILANNRRKYRVLTGK